MALSDAERQRNRRARLKVVPAEEPEEPGPVMLALEQTLAAIQDPDPTLCALARAAAMRIDVLGTAEPARSAELRRLVSELRAEERRKGAPAGKIPKDRPASWVEDMRRARAAGGPKRTG